MEKIEWPEGFPSVDKMVEILKKTIQTSWQCDLSSEEIEHWLANFTGEVFDEVEERNLALWMLCNFTYYNEQEVNHLCRMLYKQFIHDIAKKENIEDVQEIKTLLDSTYFAAIGKAGESGGLLLYFFRQEAKLSIDRFCYPTHVPYGENNIAVFIDDVTLSGGTAARFFYNHLQDAKYKRIYYITLFATETAVEKLEGLGITVICCNLLDERDKCFSEKSIMFYNYPTLREKAELMAKHYGEKLEKGKALGHKDGQLCFGFNYNVPNNSLPIFWSSNNWYPIFMRKEKIQNVKNRNDEFERYI